jgi:hypothetical protein
MHEFWEAALANLRKARARVAERYDAGRREAEFRVGDLVLVRLHPLSSKSQQRSAKLDFKWSVPLVIAKYVSPVTVLLANPDTGVVIRKAHVSQLKSYFSGKYSETSSYRFPGSIVQFLWSLNNSYLNYGNKTRIDRSEFLVPMNVNPALIVFKKVQHHTNVSKHW